MPRLMSVSMTEQAVVERRKTVTRRKGWWLDSRGRRLVVPGDHLILCRKVMGRKPGEPLVRLAEVEVLDVRRERLGELLSRNLPEYGPDEVAREGFPGMDPMRFIDRFFINAQGIQPAADVTRIEWRYLDTQPCGRTVYHLPHDTTTGRCPGHQPPPTLPADQTHRLADHARKKIRHA